MENNPRYPHREMREKSFIEQMKQEGCEYFVWPGVMAKPKLAGINAAHRQIIRYAKENNLPEVCIAEDDFKFTAPGSWKYFLDNKPQEYDIYTSSYYSGKHDDNFVVKGFRGLTLYCVHKRYYDTYLSLPENRHIDGAIAASGAVVVVSPKFVTFQMPGWSEQRGQFAENKIKNKEFFTQ